MAIIFRELKEEEIDKIALLDRSEEIFELYEYHKGNLVLKPHRETVIQFDTTELEEMIIRQKKIQKDGGYIVGAFDQDELAGVASVEKTKRGIASNYCKMDILYVSRNYRAMKLGYKLLEECKKTAKEFGAQSLYISATPTKNTVDFYLKNSAILTTELDTELYKLEPDDIHLEMPVSS
jgi:GNAT superfamily N-acetyltransferase